MVCYSPLTAYAAPGKTDSGKKKIVFNRQNSYVDLSPLELPCGQCIGCRLERSRQWAIRCTHESQLHLHNSFITLTYSPEFLPENGNLKMSDFQKFMKRLRKKIGKKVRFYHAGEYGSKLQRPHYHACIFGYDFPDKRLWKVIRGQPLYRSAELEQLWPFGHSSIGNVTFESAAYVARYIMKKVNGKRQDEHYEAINPVTGEVVKLTPEYTTMSRRPGIGAGWYDKFKDDVYSGDRVIINGKKMRPPKYYDRCYELDQPERFKKIKEKRKTDAKKHVDNNTFDRRVVRAEVAKSKLKLLQRSLEDSPHV